MNYYLKLGANLNKRKLRIFVISFWWNFGGNFVTFGKCFSCLTLFVGSLSRNKCFCFLIGYFGFVQKSFPNMFWSSLFWRSRQVGIAVSENWFHFTCKGSFIWYGRKISWKANIFYPMLRTRTYDTRMCVSRGNKCFFFGKFCVGTKWMSPEQGKDIFLLHCSHPRIWF